MDDDQWIVNMVRRSVRELTPEEVRYQFRPRDDTAPEGILLAMTLGIQNPEVREQILFEKDVKVFGGINKYVEAFLPKTLESLPTLPIGQKEITKQDARNIVSRMLAHPGLSAANRQSLQEALAGPLVPSVPAAAGKRRRRKTRRRAS